MQSNSNINTKQQSLPQSILGIIVSLVLIFVILGPVMSVVVFVSGPGIIGTIVTAILYIIIFGTIYYLTHNKYALFASKLLLTAIGVGLLILIITIGGRIMLK